MSNSPAEPPEVMNPADKPFYLVLILLLSVVGIGAYAVISKDWADAKDFITVLSPLLGAGLGLYFKANT